MEYYDSFAPDILDRQDVGCRIVYSKWESCAL